MRKSRCSKEVHDIKSKKRKAGLFSGLLKKLAFFGIVVFVFMILVIIIGVVSTISDDSSSNSNNSAYSYDSSGGYPDTVEAYRPLITKLCDEYNTSPDKLYLPDYVNAMLALIQIESGGLGTDPMQASECGYNTEYENAPNAIKDAEYSCRCGVQYARDAFIQFSVESASDFDRMAAAVQGYNFGITGWYNWISKRGGKYTVELAKEYSDTMMPANAKGTPTHGQKFLNAYKAGIVSASSGSDTIDNMVYYKQWDERWAAYPYGSSNIQHCGCGITCMAMCVATFCDKSVTPPTMADLSMKNGGYIPGQGSAMPAVVAAAAKEYKISYKSISSKEVKKYINEKNALIIWGAKTGYFSNSSAGHVMIIRGVTDNDKYLLADPNCVENNSKEFELSFLENEATGYYIAVWKKE